MQGQAPSATTPSAEQEKQAAAGSSVWAAIFLTIMKLVVGFLTGSLGMLAEAAHSGLDLVAAVVTFLAVTVSGKPADQDHTYGHGKIENFSALIETGLLFITCAWIVYEAAQRLLVQAPEVDPNFWAFASMGISIVVNMNRSKMLYAAARKHHSQALEADALHFRTDVWSSWVVVGGLALVWVGQNLIPTQAEILNRADPIAALGVAVIVIMVTFNLGKRTIDALLDRAPEGLPQQIADATGGVPGVLGTGQVRVRRSGPRLFVDLNVDVDRNLPFERTHAIAAAVEEQVRGIAPGADVVVHTDPRERERETVAERIRTVASKNQLAVHNISMHEAEGQTYVDLHLEVDDHLSLRQAHDLASQIEQELRTDMEDLVQVNTHIESRGTGVGNGLDVTAKEPDLVRQIAKITDEVAGPLCCHDVALRQQGDALAVSLHCAMDENLSITQVHDISTHIETRLQETIPSLRRVLVHAEPKGK